MTTLLSVLVSIMQLPGAEWPVHWSLTVGHKSEPFLQQEIDVDLLMLALQQLVFALPST